ncbi:MAG: helix-turn-helix domain-containing protein [Promethearchaeota archaeon]
MDNNLKREILSEIQELRKSFVKANSPFMDIVEASQLLKCSVSTVRHLVRKGLIPYRRLPGGQKSKLLFNRKKLIMWVEYEGKLKFTKREREQAEAWV